MKNPWGEITSGLEELFIEEEEEEDTSQDSWSSIENRVFFSNLLKKRQQATESGIIYFYMLFSDSTLESYPSLKRGLQSIIGQLTSKEFKTLKYIFSENLKLTNIAKKMKISRSSVKTYRDRGLKKILQKMSQKKENKIITRLTTIKVPVEESSL